MADKDICYAGGGLVWRALDGNLTLAVVHRPKYDDWSLPKGKAIEGVDRSLEETAIRETEEETGWRVAIIDFAGEVSYLNKGKRKVVQFWNMSPISKSGDPDPGEIDRLEWLETGQALDLLSYKHDRTLIRNNFDRIFKKVIGADSK